MLVEGEEGAEGHSCGLFEELQWELGVDTVTGLVYGAKRSVNLVIPLIQVHYKVQGSKGHDYWK